MKEKTLYLVQFSILLALEAIVCFTPLGALPAVGPIVATLGAIPIIITAIMLGPKAGTVMGLLAGLFSLIIWTFMPPPLSAPLAFIFTPFYSVGQVSGNFGSLLISVLPRALVGTVAGLTYKALSKSLSSKNILSFSISAILGSLTNTFLVMGGIWLFFGNQYSSLLGDAMIKIIGLTILTSGIPEAIVAAVVATAICKPLKRVLSKDQ